MQVSDKETRAVFLNFKELRCLEKAVVSLDLEKAYSVSLINLDKKVMKVKEKKMKDRVGKIKSHLSQNDIEEMKKLEEAGTLGIPESTNKLDSHIRIAAASKRLKLLPRSKSAVPRLNTGRRSALSRSPLPSSRGRSPAPTINEPENVSNFPVPRSVRTERRNSICIRDQSQSIESNSVKPRVPKIAFERTVSRNSNLSRDDKHMNSPRARILDDVGDELSKENFYLQIPEENYKSPKSPTSSSTTPRAVNSKSRPVSVPATQISNFQVNVPKRPSTTIPKAHEARKKSVADIRRASRMLASGNTRIPYTSHEYKPKQSPLKQPYRSIRDGAMSAIDFDTSDDIGNELFKQIKQGMILGEVATTLYLEDRIDSFFDNLDKYKRENPTKFEPTDLTKPVKKTEEKKVKPKRNQLRRRQLEIKLQDVEAKQKMAEEMWNNLSKCRYLRLGDENLDTSGVNTLVVDQMKVHKALREYDD